MVPGMDTEKTPTVAEAGDDAEQVITPWEKTDEALAAAAELMPECEIAHGVVGEDGEPADDEPADGGGQ